MCCCIGDRPPIHWGWHGGARTLQAHGVLLTRSPHLGMSVVLSHQEYA